MLMHPIFFLWFFISVTLSHPFMKGNPATTRSKSHPLNSASHPLNSASHPLNSANRIPLNSKPKLCVNCKHFIADPNNPNHPIYGKCKFFPIDNKYLNDIDYLVSGIKKNVAPEYQYCSILRKNEALCGISGKMHKRKYIKKAQNSTVGATVVAGPGKQMNGNTTVQPRFNGTKTQSQSQYYSASSQVNPIQLDYSSLRPVSLLKSIL